MKIDHRTTSRDLELNLGVENVNYVLDKSNSYQPGVVVTLIHFFLSQLRSKKSFSLFIDTGSINEKDLSSKFFEYYQLVSVLLFDNTNRIKFQGNERLVEILRNEYQEMLEIQENLYSMEMGLDILDGISKTKLENLRKSLFAVKSDSKLSSGFSFLIPCFDHKNSLKESNYLYSGSFIKSSIDMEQWIMRLFKFHKLSLDPSGLHKSTVSHIAEIVKELFHNTHDWARTTYDDSNVYSPNFRGAYLSLYLENRLRKKSDLGSIDAVDDYLKLVHSKNLNDLQIEIDQQFEIFHGSNKVSICEISVLDTGRGMGPRWMEKEYNKISKEEEKESVLKCFHKYITSDQSGLMSLRGQGLSKVLSIIGNIGFIRVHSGGVLLTRNFLDKKLSSSEIDSGLINFKYESVNRIEGTCTTILYPIIYEMK